MASMKFSLEEYIEQFKIIHNNKYDYSHVTPFSYNNPIIWIGCPIHGLFDQRYHEHYHGKGCRHCAPSEMAKTKTKGIDKFIEDAKLVWGDRFDYSLVDYKRNNKPIKIICKKHGAFDSTPALHLNGISCKKCSEEEGIYNPPIDRDIFIKRSIEKHGDKYDYSNVIFNGVNKEVSIICPIHGPFPQTPTKHMKGHGCRKCGHKLIGEANTLTQHEYVERVKQVHGDKYDYSELVYENIRSKVKVFCNTHKKYFYPNAFNFVNGTGCKDCAKEGNMHSRTDWIKKAGNKVGTFYIIRCYNETESFYKYGITFNGLKKRYKNETEMPYKYEIVRLIISSDKGYIWDLEKRFGRFKVHQRYKPQIFFQGSAMECFSHFRENKNTPAGAIVVVDAPKKPIYIQMQLDFAC